MEPFEFEHLISETCERLRETTKIDVIYWDGKVKLGRKIIFRGAVRDCAHIISGMYLMAKLQGGRKHGTDKR